MDDTAATITPTGGEPPSFGSNSYTISIPQLNPLKALALLMPRSVYTARVAQTMADNVALGSDLIGRPLEPHEAAAFAEPAPTLVTAPRWGAMIGGSLGGFLASMSSGDRKGPAGSEGGNSAAGTGAGAEAAAGTEAGAGGHFHGSGPGQARPLRLRFPFRLPPTLNRVPLSKLALLSLSGALVGSLTGNIYAAGTATRALAVDPRLARFRADRATQDPEAIMRRVREHAARRVKEHEREWAARRGEMGDAVGGLRTQASTSAGWEGDERMDDASATAATAAPSTAASGPYANSATVMPGWVDRGSSVAPPPATDTDTSTSADDFFDLNLSNPDSPSYRPPPQAYSQPTARGSWDRIRRASSGQSTPWPSPGRSDGASGDYGYGRYGDYHGREDVEESDSAAARRGRVEASAQESRASQEAAQAEFDRMVERERHVGEEGDGLMATGSSGRKGGWSGRW